MWRFTDDFFKPIVGNLRICIPLQKANTGNTDSKQVDSFECRWRFNDIAPVNLNFPTELNSLCNSYFSPLATIFIVFRKQKRRSCGKFRSFRREDRKKRQIRIFE